MFRRNLYCIIVYIDGLHVRQFAGTKVQALQFSRTNCYKVGDFDLLKSGRFSSKNKAMDNFIISFDRFYTKCRLVSSTKTTEWYKLYHRRSNQSGVAIYVSYFFYAGNAIPVRFLPVISDSYLNLLLLSN